jgi:transposase
MPKQGGKFVLSSAEEAQLQQLIRAHGTPQGLAQRVRVVQLASQGIGVRTIGERVGMHYNQVAKWRRRYLRGGIGALQDEPRSGRKGNISTELLRQIVDQATRPPQGRVRWTCRAMAREFGVSKATVQRVWSQNEIKPQNTRTLSILGDNGRWLVDRYGGKNGRALAGTSRPRCAQSGPPRPAERWRERVPGCAPELSLKEHCLKVAQITERASSLVSSNAPRPFDTNESRVRPFVCFII